MTAAAPFRLLPRWAFPAPGDSVACDALQRELKLPPALCRLLVQRGHGTAAAAREFLKPHAGQLHPPDFAGIGDAVARLRLARQRGETVLVHGDYDVDGICATAIYTRALTMMGLKPVPFVPHRLKDGYDLSAAGVQAAASAGATLILTGDCGIVAHDAVAAARSAGIDTIITDHHTPAATLPDAAAVVNPNRCDCSYPNKGLVGAGVAFKVCQALADELGFPAERLVALLDLVALATVADIGPLQGENRALVRWGLKVLPRTPNPGLRALLGSTGLAGRDEITAGHLGFVLGPRLNAVGRMGEALRGVRLLLTSDAAEAARIAAVLETENRARREAEQKTLDSVLGQLGQIYDPAETRGVVLSGEGWHPGVIGIVASRIVERIHRPVMLIALDGDADGKGSARSVPGFHMHQALQACAAHLVRFGGHRAAAGCTIRPEAVAAFRDAFDAHARSVLEEPMLEPELRIDIELRLADADLPLLRVLRHAAPFGMGNPTPVLAARGVRMSGEPRIVGRDHLKMTLADGATRLDAIGFGMGGRLPELVAARNGIDVAFKLDEDNYRRGRDGPRVQARVADFRAAGGG